MKKKLTLRIPVWLIIVVVLAVNIWILCTQVFTPGFWDRKLLSDLTPEDILSIEFSDTHAQAEPLRLNDRQIRQVVEALNALEPKGEPYATGFIGGASYLNFTLKNGDCFFVYIDFSLLPHIDSRFFFDFCLYEADSGWRYYEFSDQDEAADRFCQLFSDFRESYYAQTSN